MAHATKGIVLFILTMLVSCKNYKSILTYSDVVSKMTNMEALANLPEQGEKSGMFSSYDRKSVVDESNGTFIDWSANNDGLSPQYIRKEGENMVLAEMQGPGAIVRIWSASPKKGHVKIYIDGSEIPVIDLPFIDYFDNSKLEAFAYPNLVYETDARGYNNYVPITFQKSIKIVGEPDWGQYYHFNYIKFSEKTIVPSFQSSLDAQALSALKKVDKDFSNSSRNILNYDGFETEELTVVLKPGESKPLFLHDGSGAISSLQIKMGNINPEKKNEIYRKTVLTAKWDSNEVASIWSPIGDFFGSAPGYNEYNTYPMGMENGWMYSNWYMPFGEGAELSLTNLSEVNVELKAKIAYKNNINNPEKLGRFHAKWHRDILSVSKDRWPDWTVLETKGAGRFVGMFLSVWSPNGGSCKAFGGEGQHWWGEGDEKFFVDGEAFPSTFGTGTEDYFGYAWCIPDFFQQAYHSQNYTEGNMGYQSLNRWQIIDNVPFAKSFDAYMEKYFPNNWPTQYACVAYWYLDKNGKDSIEATPKEELYGYETKIDLYKADNAIEGEDMKVVSNTGGWYTIDAFSDETMFDEVSGHKMLLWFGKKEDESVLEIDINHGKTGTYNVSANVICSKDGGTFAVALGGKVLSNPINCHSDGDKKTTKLLKLGTIKLNETDLRLEFKWLKDYQGKRLELDYLKLERIK